MCAGSAKGTGKKYQTVSTLLGQQKGNWVSKN